MLQKLKKMGYLFWLTVLAAFVLAGLTIYQAYDKVQSDNDAIQERKTADQERIRADEARKETKISQEKAEKYLNSLKEANGKIEMLNQESLNKADEIINKNEELIRTQNESIKMILGDGVPKIEFSYYGINNLGFSLRNSSAYPIYDVGLIIENFSEIMKCDKVISNGFVTFDQDCYGKSSTNKGEYFLASGVTQKIGFNLPSSPDVTNLRIQSVARNKITIYFCLFKLVKDKVLFCYKAYHLKSRNEMQFIEAIEDGLKLPNDKYFEDNFLIHLQGLTHPKE